MKRLLPLLAASTLSLPLPSPASDVRVDMGRLSVPDVPIEFHAVAHRPDWTGRGEQSLSLEEDGSGCHAFAIRLDGTTFDGRASYREEDGAVRAEWSMAPDRDVELACLCVSGTLPLSTRTSEAGEGRGSDSAEAATAWRMRFMRGILSERKFFRKRNDYTSCIPENACFGLGILVRCAL